MLLSEYSSHYLRCGDRLTGGYSSHMLRCGDMLLSEYSSQDRLQIGVISY